MHHQLYNRRLKLISNNKKCNVIILLVFIVLIDFQSITCNNTNGLKTKSNVAKCIQRCPEIQNRTNSDQLDDDDDETVCKNDCHIKQCTIGCQLWESALDSSCQIVCNKTDKADFDLREIYCVMGCNDALNLYFQWLKQEIGTPTAPALVADSLTATSLSLEWSVPPKFSQLAHTKNYLVQCYEGFEDDWKSCRNQTIGDNSTVRVDNLQPYTKYRFRVALLLSENEAIISEQSVIISTLAQGTPMSKPIIVRCLAVDQTRISISWEPGAFVNGPILSYALLIKDLIPTGYFAIKDVPASDKTNFYMFEKLAPARNYNVSIAVRNARGVGPIAETTVSTPPYLTSDLSKTHGEPKLIIAAEYSVMSSGTDFLLELPITFYRTQSRIVGMAIHVWQKLMFVSEENGCIYQMPLDLKGERKEIINQKPALDFKPTLLSVDWLNNFLYILGEKIINSHHNSPRSWAISRCDLNGKKLTVAVGGLNKKPDHFEVDPYNGYLFWVITGDSIDSGLFRLDLGDISNGVKHDVQPLPMIKGENLGAFTVDHTRFRLMIPLQNNNTVISVSLDGKEQEDIRKNTQSPLLHLVKSFAIANGLFYWTNGKEVLTEEYHSKHNSYFHNAYPDFSKTPLISVCVNSSEAQPIPIPVNPPSNVQALLGSSRAKVSWRIPHLLGNQGKGAFQNWYYELEVFDSEKKKEVFRNISGFTYTVTNLKPNTLYTFRTCSYTNAGKGPWSQEFKAKTLKTSDERHLIWSSNDGLLQSDVIGENIITLLPKAELGDSVVADIEWFEDILYIVTNSTLKFYNRTNGLQKLGELDSVGGVAVDWVGKRLYWSNPSQQLITRGRLNGEQQEPLSIIAAAREIKIDALRGNIYYTTGLTIDTCRLNGKNRKSYFSVAAYSGKQVMGLTLDLDNENIYWIVRSFSVSSLFSAKLVDLWIGNEPIIVETILEERSLNGPLTHFSDRLVWRQDDKTIVFGDMGGKNLAYMENTNLIGLTCLAVIDKTHHIYPNITKNATTMEKEIVVIPDAVLLSSIRILGTWKIFKIIWEPIQNVNYGNVYYDIKVKANKQDFNTEQTESFFAFPPHTLPPYTSMEIFIRAFTYWGSSPVTKIFHLHSPPAPPSAPTHPRVYIQHISDPHQDNLNVTATFRWSLPVEPNGQILGYKIKVSSKSGHNGAEKIIYDNVVVVSVLEEVIGNLHKNNTYTFQVLAYSSVGDGASSAPIHMSAVYENPVPKVLVATQEEILEVDLDLKRSQMLVNTRNPVVSLSHIAHEQRLYWFNDNNELITYRMENHTKTKLMTTTAKVQAMTIDWIERVVYWIQVDNNKAVIYSYNLNRAENIAEQVHNRYAQKVLERQDNITDLVVSPFDRKLFWIENHKNLPEESAIYYYDLDSLNLRILFENSEECTNITTISPVEGSLVLATSAINPSLENIGGDYENYQSLLVFDYKNSQFMATDIRTNGCFNFGTVFHSGNNLAKNSDYLFWINEGMVYGQNDLTNKHKDLEVPNASKLMAFYRQQFPKRSCLFPDQTINYETELLEATEDSIKIELPIPYVPSDCALQSIPVEYTIHYTDVKHHNVNIVDMRCIDHEDCHKIHSYERIKVIERLKPFTNYFIQIAMKSIYQNDSSNDIHFGVGKIFSTKPGAPSEPRNVTAIPLSFSEVLVNWVSPEIFNSAAVFYEIHWQTENIVNGLKNKQQQLVSDFGSIVKNSSKSHHEDLITITLQKLMPKQSYTIWIRAYSTNHTFSESDSVNVETYSEPEAIILDSTTPYSMIIKWIQPQNITSYEIQYSAIDYNHELNKVDKVVSMDDHNASVYHVERLHPKTKYNFSINLNYVNNPTRAYRWPPEKNDEVSFIFETLGDCPSAPGKPTVRHVSDSIYQVLWESSRDNGASIQEYSLEAIRTKEHSVTLNNNQTVRHVRSAKDSNDVDPPDHENEIHYEENTDMPNEIEEPAEVIERWNEYYHGEEAYWIIKNLHPIEEYVFRVRALNDYGWGNYSAISDFVDIALASTRGNDPGVGGKPKEDNHILMMLVALPISIIVLFCLFLCLLVVLHRKHRNKKFSDDIIPIPDLELATLRELHHGDHLILSNHNILYNNFYGTSQMNTEIALLPHIRREKITITDLCLGKGAFGEVHGGVVRNDDLTEERVAIKTLHKGANDMEKKEFLQEAQLMSNFKHDHILKLIGICLDNHESLLYIVMELMEGGDLLSYLRDNRPTTSQSSSLTLLDLVSMCVDVASGCRYLEEMHFVHRDIAARNCLVKHVLLPNGTHSRVVKIGDFGLARDIYKNDYYRKEGEGLLPVRWMSPESLVDGVFTSQSDIWSFGVLCWEIMTMGQQPYPARTNIDVLHYVRGGGRLPRPSTDCPEDLYQLMNKCWNFSADQRPTFRYCLEVLQLLQEKTNHYIKITTQFPAEPFKLISSNGSSSINEHNSYKGSLETPSNTNSGGLEQTSIPKYLELMYDESIDSNNNDNMSGAPLAMHLCEQHQPENLVSRQALRSSQRASWISHQATKDDGYEIPISLDSSTVNNNLVNNSKSRTLSNSSTVSNKSNTKLPSSINDHPINPALLNECAPSLENESMKFTDSGITTTCQQRVIGAWV